MAREWETQVTKKAPPMRLTARRPQVPAGTTVIRSDAAWTPGGSRAGLGWVTFSTEGLVPASKRVSFFSSALMAEDLALLEAIRTGKRAELLSVVFESDSAQLVNVLKSGSCLPALYGVLTDIVSLLPSFVSVDFVWISREKNALADRFAKSTLLCDEPVVDDVIMALN